jgi:hypothetical protein
MKPTATNQMIIGKNDNNTIDNGWYIQRASPDFIFVFERSVADLRAYVNDPPSNVWTHVVVTYPATTSAAGVKIYFNGALQNHTSDDYDGAGTIGSDASDVMFIGLNRPSSDEFGNLSPFGGVLDDLRIYNRALSAGEVMQLYKLGTATIGHSNEKFMTNGLVGYWTFDGSATNFRTNTTADLSGNGNTGTLVNMSTTTSPVAGKIGQALTFNNTSQYVNVPDPGSGVLDFSTGSMSASAWFKAPQQRAAYQSILNKGGETSGTEPQYDLLLKKIRDSPGLKFMTARMILS